jgi:hypothetical protein
MYSHVTALTVVPTSLSVPLIVTIYKQKYKFLISFRFFNFYFMFLRLLDFNIDFTSTYIYLYDVSKKVISVRMCRHTYVLISFPST